MSLDTYRPLPRAAQTSPVQRLRTLWLDRLDRRPAWILLIELFLGIGWLRAAVEKLADAGWWSGRVLDAYVAEATRHGLPWYGWIAEGLVSPNTLAIAVLVVAAQLALGVALLVGRPLLPALAVGGFLSLNFLAAGEVNPAIFYLISHAVVVLWVLEHRMMPSQATRVLRMVRRLAVAGVIVSLPFMATMQPEDLVADPGAVMGLFGVLVIVGSSASLRAIRLYQLRVKAAVVGVAQPTSFTGSAS